MSPTSYQTAPPRVGCESNDKAGSPAITTGIAGQPGAGDGSRDMVKEMRLGSTDIDRGRAALKEAATAGFEAALTGEETAEALQGLSQTE